MSVDHKDADHHINADDDNPKIALSFTTKMQTISLLIALAFGAPTQNIFSSSELSTAPVPVAPVVKAPVSPVSPIVAPAPAAVAPAAVAPSQFAENGILPDDFESIEDFEDREGDDLFLDADFAAYYADLL